MAKFNVEVILTAKCEYTVEVEASDESEAQQTAIGMWRTKTPEDWQVEKGYITDWEAEAEAVTFDCEECGEEFPIAQRHPELGEYCAACGAKMEAEDKANGR